MNLGTRAMFANYAALQTTSNNIANANTPGYSRQETRLANSDGQFTGAGFFGQGVDVTSVTRSYDRFLTMQAVNTQSTAAADTAHRDQLSLLEGVFTTGEGGLGHAAGRLLNAFVDVASNPADSSARQVVIGQATDLAARFMAAGDQLSALQGSVVDDVRSAVGSVNGIAQQIAKMNGRISALLGSGQPPNDLLDQRDQLISQLSQYIGVTTVAAGDGSVGVFVGGGQSLVLGTSTNALAAVPDSYDPAKLRLAMRDGNAMRLLAEQSIAGGSISGQLRFQNTDLVDARNLLGQLAVAASAALNTQQSLGLDLGGRHGAPLFAVGGARALPASTNNGNAGLQFAVADATRVTASDYELRYDGNNYSVERLNADGTRSAVAGSPLASIADVAFDGMRLQLGAGAMQAGDRFLLQPTALAAQAMTSVLRDPSGIAAASPVTATLGAANSGTASLAALSAVSPNIDPTLLPTAITFDAALPDGSVPFRVLNADGSADSGVWTAGQPFTLNGFALSLDGVPQQGDTIAVLAGQVGGNNGNALAFARLASTALVEGRNITDAYASALSDVAVRVQSARSGADTSAAFAGAAESARANKSGVNLDEEASRLIQFQQSYQAAAKVLQVAQSVFDTLLRTAGT